jgi:hypothetical protein
MNTAAARLGIPQARSRPGTADPRWPRLLAHVFATRGTEGLVRGSKLEDGSSVSRGCWRAHPNVRPAARMRVPARGAGGESLSGATAGRQAEPVLPFRPLRGGWRPRERGPGAGRRAAGPLRTGDAQYPRRPRLLAYDLRLRHGHGASRWAAVWSPAAAGGAIPTCTGRRA